MATPTLSFFERPSVVLAWMLLGVVTALSCAPPPESRVLECESVFPPTIDQSALEERFGKASVVTEAVDLGEGFTEDGTVLFPTSDADRVEILWKDAERRRAPRTVRIRGDNSTWRTDGGVSLGDDLQTVEQSNGGSFRLTGFGWDYSGTQLSWSGGALEAAPESKCGLRVRMRPVDPADEASYRQVLGDGGFSSGHPAMQTLNPRIYELWLEY